MSRGVSDKITFKPYSQTEQWLLPPSLDELVPENHFVRIVSKTVDELRIEDVFAKYTSYEKETKRSFKKKIFNAENWKYDAEQKEYTCPCGNPVPYKKTETKRNKSGYEQTYEVYQCDNCEGCPFRELCTKSEYGRMVQRNEHWLEQKSKVKELLAKDEYKKLMKKRSTECETVFGQIKGNQHFRRFNLRGKEKVGTEWGLLMIGYDFKQIARLMNA